MTFIPKEDTFLPQISRESLLGAVSSPVTELLLRWSEGDSAAREKLIPLVYDELRRLARRYRARETQNQTMQSTALVHEAYVRLVGSSSVRWNDRVHFFAVVAQLMRNVLVDHARAKNAKKRGGRNLTMILNEDVALSKQRDVDLIALDSALNSLAAVDERQCRIVELRFLAGLSIKETSQALVISPATVKREWATARLWLLRQMSHTTQA